jgi:tRNA1(Val) A37 N6-methylase TrmN6
VLFYQPIDGYSYNSDSIYLYDFIKSFKPKGNLLDVGSGCGVIGLLLARDCKINLHQVELQDEMSFLSTQNSKINNINTKHYKTNFLEFESDKKFDYIVSNPPFYHQDVVQSENKQLNICRYNNHLPIKEFFKKVNSLLTNRGYFIFCYHPRELSEIIVELKNNKMTLEDMRFIHPKKSKDANLVMIKCRKSSKAMVKLHKPFITFDGDEFSEEVKDIYKKARTHTIKCKI